MRTCKTCKEEKNEAEFYTRNDKLPRIVYRR